jgi:hypothetical protein
VLWVQFVLLRAEREIGRQMLAVFFSFFPAPRSTGCQCLFKDTLNTCAQRGRGMARQMRTALYSLSVSAYSGGGGGSRSGGGTHETHALDARRFFFLLYLVPMAARLWCILRRVFLPFLLLEDVARVWDDAECEVVAHCCTRSSMRTEDTYIAVREGEVVAHCSKQE